MTVDGRFLRVDEMVKLCLNVEWEERLGLTRIYDAGDDLVYSRSRY